MSSSTNFAQITQVSQNKKEQNKFQRATNVALFLCKKIAIKAMLSKHLQIKHIYSIIIELEKVFVLRNYTYDL